MDYKDILKQWPFIIPIASALALYGVMGTSLPGLQALWLVLALLLSVITSVHHAEVIAHRLGEPFGTLVLALAVTVIETALVLSMMLAANKASATLPRDTIYSAVMIACNGVVGICLLLGGLHHKEQLFRIEGTGSGFAALATLSVMVLVMPLYTISSSEGTYTDSQLIFVALSSLALWLVFVFIQTIRHRDYFLPMESADDESVHALPPGLAQTRISFFLLLVSLVCVVGFAKLLSPSIESVVKAYRAPAAVVGIVIALIVLLPETWAAVRAAAGNRLQTSLNLALGSALASIGLTIPVVVVLSLALDRPLLLGLPPKETALLALTLLVATLTLSAGRTTVLQGAVHLVLFCTFLFLAAVP